MCCAGHPRCLYGQNPPVASSTWCPSAHRPEARNEVFVQGGTFDRLQGGFDFTGPVNDDGSLLYRLVGVAARVARKSISSMTTGSMSHRASPGIRPTIPRSPYWVTSSATTPAFRAVFPRRRHDPALSNGSYIPTSQYIGEPAVDRFDRRIWSIGYDFSHVFNEALTFRQAVRYTNSNVYNHAVFTTGVLANNRTITRRLSSIDRTLDYFNIDNQLLGTLDTGPLVHQWIIGFDHRNNSETATNGRATATNLDVMNPVYAGGVGPYVLTQNYKDYVRQTGHLCPGSDPIRRLAADPERAL